MPAISKKVVSVELLKADKLDFVQDENGIKITLNDFASDNKAVDTVVKIIVE